MNEKLQVRFWDGTIKYVNNQEEAITTIKDGLDAWMEKGDKIRWLKHVCLAIVVNALGEETDACAIIENRKVRT